MTQSDSSTPDSLPSPHGEVRYISPRSELIAGLAWMALGAAVLIGSVLMDRLEQQHINPYTVPGLLPGLLGILMLLLGFLLALRSLGRGALHSPASPAQGSGGSRKRILLVVGLCTTFAVVLVGHGLPFWAAGAIFVTASILSLQHSQRVADGQGLSARLLLRAVVIGLGSSLTIALIFQEAFLVRLP